MTRTRSCQWSTAHGRVTPLQNFARCSNRGPKRGLGEWSPPVEETLQSYVEVAATVSRGYVVLLLDQFEEYLLYHPPGARLDGELAEALSDPGLPLSVLVSMREDALARLDRFDGLIPYVLDHMLRIEHLTEAGGRGSDRRAARTVPRRNGHRGPTTRTESWRRF